MCGIFGMIRKPGAPCAAGATCADAIEAVRHRGAGLGGGFARVTARGADAPHVLRAFAEDETRVDALRRDLLEEGFRFADDGLVKRPREGAVPVWTVTVTDAPADVPRAVDRVNARHLDADGFRARVVACARHADAWKDVAHPEDVAQAFGLRATDGDAWLAHTREPTNSPGRYPITSHPFTAGEVAVVHNGDVASFGANVRFLRRRGFGSFTGTDTEPIAVLLHHLLFERGMAPADAARVLADPDRGGDDPALAGAGLDGPFAVAATWSTGDESFLLVTVDHAKLRPLVLGEDGDAFYAASEEGQIRAVSPDARVWTPEPGATFLASTKQGIIDAGRVTSRPPARRAPTPADASAAVGTRFIGGRATAGDRLTVSGPTGNVLANSLNGGEVVVHGNVADDAADAMLDGRVIVHGDARDVLGQALQGGRVLVRGSAGNRGGILMREFEDTVPDLVIGGGVDDYFGEYMAGGRAVVVNLVDGPDGLTVDDAPARPTGAYVGTGMVGGDIYVRGDVRDDAIGMPPADEDVAQYADTLVLDGVIDAATAAAVKREPDPEKLRAMLPEMAHALLKLVESKYTTRPRVARRRLTDADRARIGPALHEFFDTFDVPEKERERVLTSTWTVISGRGGAADEQEEG